MSNVCIVLDFDGTLVSNRKKIIAVGEFAFEPYPNLKPSETDLLKTVGLKPAEMIKRLTPGQPADVQEVIFDRFSTRSKALREAEKYPEIAYPSAEHFLNKLRDRDWKICVATGKSKTGLKMALDRLKWHSYFDILRCSEDGRGKPNPDILLDIVQHFGTQRRDVLMIGDSVYDMQMAVLAGIDGVGVSWGYNSETDLYEAGAKRVVENFSTLLEHMESRFVEDGCS